MQTLTIHSDIIINLCECTRNYYSVLILYFGKINNIYYQLATKFTNILRLFFVENASRDNVSHENIAVYCNVAYGRSDRTCRTQQPSRTEGAVTASAGTEAPDYEEVDIVERAVAICDNLDHNYKNTRTILHT